MKFRVFLCKLYNSNAHYTKIRIDLKIVTFLYRNEFLSVFLILDKTISLSPDINGIALMPFTWI